MEESFLSKNNVFVEVLITINVHVKRTLVLNLHFKNNALWNDALGIFFGSKQPNRKITLNCPEKVLKSKKSKKLIEKLKQ